MAWKDVSFNVAVFGFFTNGIISAMDISGYFDTLGVELTVMPSVEIIKNEVTTISASQGVSDTLFALISILVNVARFVFDFLFAFPNLFYQLSFPGWFVGLIFFANALFWFAAIFYAYTGREF